MVRKVSFVLCAAAITVWGCDRGGPGVPGTSRAALRSIEGCEDLEAVLRASAISEMRTAVLANYEQAISGDYCYPYDEDYGADAGADGDTDTDTDSDGDGDGDESASEYSTTNVQEVGVDEADFIKNDGSYIYMVSGMEFLIIDAWPAETSEIIARVTLEGPPRQLYVYEDHAVIYSDIVNETSAGYGDCYVDEWSGEYVCGASTSGTRVSVFDITDRAAPRLLREIDLSGLYVSSRRVDEAVHTVMTYPEISFPDLSYWPEDIDYCDASLRRELIWRAFAQLIERNEEIINTTPLEGWIPTIADTRYDASGEPTTDLEVLGDCRGFYEAVGSSGRSFLSVVSFDVLDDDGDVNVSSIVGNQGTVYASREALYVASQQYMGESAGWYYDDPAVTEATTIHRFNFDLESPTTSYDASGVVPGRILNQFSMGENEGYLRVATTVGYLPSPDCSNNVFVLESRDGSLDVVGEVTGIAPAEDIRSARFVGDRGFVVTFKKTDPLFVLDLSDPTNPRLAGELEIPGFSTYMHMMDSDHLLTIGFDAEDMGDYAWFAGVQLQIFDVSDMANPTRTAYEIIGTRGTASEATGNHLAFNYFAPRDILAIPMAICEGGSGGDYGDVMTFNGLIVYDVTVEDGFSEHGRVDHGIPGDAANACSQWWSEQTSHVKRSVIMEDFVYSVAADRLIVAGLDDLSTPVASIELPTLPTPEYPEYD
jgi:hypothetical protein